MPLKAGNSALINFKNDLEGQIKRRILKIEIEQKFEEY